jgi:hypothetical protein
MAKPSYLDRRLPLFPQLLEKRRFIWNDCWLYTGSVTGNGYGYVNWATQLVSIHRFSSELADGPILEGNVVDHMCHDRDITCYLGNRCPHRRCFNPAHLRQITNLENQEAARNARPKSFGPYEPQWMRLAPPFPKLLEQMRMLELL